MFANQDDDAESTESTTTQSGNQFFDERSEIHEVYWIACDANRRNGPQILKNEHLSVKGTDDGVSGVVDDYRFFDEQKKELIEEITGERDMYGLRKYREDFDAPSEEMWTEAGSDHYGINIVGIHKIPEEEAREQFDVDYSKDGIDPIYVPILEEHETGEEVIYEPSDFYPGEEPEGYNEADETEAEAAQETEEEPEADTSTVEAQNDGGQGPATSTAEMEADTEAEAEAEAEGTEEPDFPASPDVVMEYLEEQPIDSLNKQQRATLAKLRDPTVSNRDIANKDMVDCSKNTVRKGLMKYLGEDGYEALKERGRQLRKDAHEEEAEAESESESQSEDYEEKMMATTSGDAEADTEDADESSGTMEVDEEEFRNMVGRLNEQEQRIQRLESLFADEVLSE